MPKEMTFTNKDFTAIGMVEAGYSVTQTAKQLGMSQSTLSVRIARLREKLDGVGKCADYVKDTYEDAVHAMCGLLLESLVDDAPALKEIPADKRVRMLKDLRSTIRQGVQELQSDPVSAFFNAINITEEPQIMVSNTIIDPDNSSDNNDV